MINYKMLYRKSQKLYNKPQNEQGNNPQEEQQEGILSNPQEEQQEQMKIGGSIDENGYLKKQPNISEMVDLKDQAVAIAYRQAEEKFGHKFQDGGQTQDNKIQQLILSYAELTQQDPNKIIEQLQQLSEDDVKSALPTDDE